MGLRMLAAAARAASPRAGHSSSFVFFRFLAALFGLVLLLAVLGDSTVFGGAFLPDMLALLEPALIDLRFQEFAPVLNFLLVAGGAEKLRNARQ